MQKANAGEWGKRAKTGRFGPDLLLINSRFNLLVTVVQITNYGVAEIKKTDVLKINWQKNNLWVGVLSFWFLSFSKKENVTRTTIYRLLFFLAKIGIVFLGRSKSE